MHSGDLDLLEVSTRLLVAILVGSAIGLNREVRNKPAGLRTHAIVSLGSALVTVTMIILAKNPAGPGFDSNAVSRAIQGIVAGVGFLGGGAILKSSEKSEVSGLTTAASIWLVASLGIAAGAGLWQAALVALVLALIFLIFGGPFEGKLKKMSGNGDPDKGENRPSYGP